MTCTAEGCDRPVHAKQLCDRHYRRTRTHPPCSLEGCDRPVHAKGLCDPHYRRTRTRPPCTVAGCDKPQQGHGLCLMHHRRAYRAEGIVDWSGLPMWTTTFWSAGTICPWCGGARNDGGLDGICYVHWVKRMEEAST